MAFSKADRYEPDVQMVSMYSKSISHPARPEIMMYLLLKGPCTVEELARTHPISTTTLSKHLKILRESGLVWCEERYPYTFYHIDMQRFEELKKYLEGFIRFFENGSGVE